MSRRIMVTGSRDWVERSIIRRALAVLPADPRGTVIVHGGARGADTLAAEIAPVFGFEVEARPADWKRYGKAAGPIRNIDMVDSGVERVLAFHLAGSKGTAHAVGYAVGKGIPVTSYVVSDGDYSKVEVASTEGAP